MVTLLTLKQEVGGSNPGAAPPKSLETKGFLEKYAAAERHHMFFLIAPHVTAPNRHFKLLLHGETIGRMPSTRDEEKTLVIFVLFTRKRVF